MLLPVAGETEHGGEARDMARSKSGGESGTIVIKKYANRRLYDTETSSYITLELLSQMTREGRDFVICCPSTSCVS